MKLFLRLSTEVFPILKVLIASYLKSFVFTIRGRSIRCISRHLQPASMARHEHRNLIKTLIHFLPDIDPEKPESKKICKTEVNSINFCF